MKTSFYYEFKREISLTIEEKALIKTIAKAFQIDANTSEWLGKSCSEPVFRCFEAPLLYAETILLGMYEDETSQLPEITHWCCMLDEIAKIINGIGIHAKVDAEWLQKDAKHGFLVPSIDQETQCMYKQKNTITYTFENEEIVPERPLLKTSLYVKAHGFSEDETRLSTFESFHNISLPASYRDFLLRYDGGITMDTYFQSIENEIIGIEGFYGFENEQFNLNEYGQSDLFSNLKQQGFFVIAKDSFHNPIALHMQKDEIHYISCLSPFYSIKLASDFTSFVMGIQRHDALLSKNEVQVYVKEETIKHRTASLIEKEMSEDKENHIQKLIAEKEEIREGYVHFDNFMFKLAVINELMYEHKLIPTFDIYELLKKEGVNPEDEFRYHGPLLLALRYFKELAISTEIAQSLSSMSLDAGGELYAQIDLEWNGENSQFDITEISEQELSAFANLKQVEVVSLASDKATRMLRKQGIQVINMYNEGDYTSTNLLSLIINYEMKCAFIDWKDSVLDTIYSLQESYGQYYQELYLIDIESRAMQLQSCIVATHGLNMVCEILKEVHLSIFSFDINCSGYYLCVTRNIQDCEVVAQKQGLYGEEEDGVLTLKKRMKEPTKQNINDIPVYRVGDETKQIDTQVYKSDAPVKPIQKKLTKKTIRVIIGCVSVVCVSILLLVLNNFLVGRRTYTLEEDLNYGFKVVCKGNDGACQLMDIDDKLILDEQFKYIEVTYSPLIRVSELEGSHYNKIYNIETGTYLDGKFLHCIAVDLKEDGKKLPYKGLLATKNSKQYKLYSAKHLDGVEVPFEEYYYAGYGTYDVDTAEEIK